MTEYGDMVTHNKSLKCLKLVKIPVAEDDCRLQKFAKLRDHHVSHALGEVNVCTCNLMNYCY